MGMTTHSKRITVGGVELEVYADAFRPAHQFGRLYGLDRVRPENRPLVAAAMAEVAALVAADSAAIEAWRAEQKAVDESYLSEDRIYAAMGARR
jgi:hypothetical protein